MSSNKLKLFLGAAALTAMAGLSAPASAALDLAEKPLYLGVPIKPAFIMTVDDSGSMQWDALSPNQNGEYVWGRDDTASEFGFFGNNGKERPASGGVDRTVDWVELFPIPGRGTRRYTIPPIPNFGFARAAEFNPGYFDPAVAYGPWLNFDGTPFESMDTPAEWQSIKVDPRSSSDLRYDLTQPIRDRSDDSAGGLMKIVSAAPLFNGFLLKDGWSIRSTASGTRACPATPSNISIPGSGSGRLVLTQDYVVTGMCTGGSGDTKGEVDVWIPIEADTPQLGGNGEDFTVREGMTIPAGTEYFTRQPCGGLGATHSLIGAWVTSASDVVLSGNCDQDGGRPGDPGTDQLNTDTGHTGDDWTLAFSYFAPTYYLSTSTSPDGNTTPVAFVNPPGGTRASTVPGNGTLYRYEIKPGNYATYPEYERAMTNYANWFLYYRTRNLAMVAALTRSLNDVNFMRIGYFLINDGDPGAVVMHEMSDFTDSTAVAGRKRLYEKMIALPASGGTPNAYAVDYMGQQFQRTSGTTSPASDPPINNVCQFSAGMLFTDGYHNGGRPTTFGNVDNSTPFFGVDPFKDGHSNTLADIAAYYYKTNLRPDMTPSLVPVPPGCAAATPDPRLDCNRKLHMNFYGITLGASGEYFGVTHQQDPSTFEITPDVFLPANKPAWKSFANDARSSVDDLWHATLNARGQYINATSPSSISQAMNAIIESINNSARRSAGTAASGARRAIGFTAYIPEFDPNSWTGDLKAYKLLPDGGLGPVVWSAVEELPVPASRTILVSRRRADDTAYELQTFNSAALGADDSERLAAIGLADADISATGTFRTRTVDELIAYLRGDSTYEGNASGQFRSRLLRNPDGTTQHRPIGDILASQPEVLDRGSEGYSLLPESKGGRIYIDGDGNPQFRPATQSSTYSKFVSGTKATRTPVLIVGANDGMIHGFDASLSGTTRGEEVFAVIPSGVLGKMGNLARRDYAHTYFVDGSPRVADACIGDAISPANCSWKSVAVMGMGNGGRSVVALDVTDPATSFDADNLLWELTSVQDSDLGHVINRPRVFIAEDGNWYAAFGNGLNSGSHRAYLYIVNLKTGAVTKKIPLGTAGSAADPNGAIAVAAVDGDGDDALTDPSENNMLVDTLYVNDFHGNVWKIDMSSATSTSWQVDLGGPLFTALAVDDAERADQRQFMTGGIDVAFHPIRGNLVYFGTGRYIANGDQNVAATPQVQSFYGIWDDPNQTAGISDRTELQAQTILSSVTVNGVNKRTTSESSVAYSGTGAKRGWYIDLYQAGVSGFRSGERVLGEPRVEGGLVIFTAFQPIGSECNPGGKNWLYAFNAVTGANGLNTPGCTECGATDLNPDGQAAPPTLTPPIVVDPAPPGDVDTDGDGVPDTPADEDCLPGTPGCTDLPSDGSPLPGRQCVNSLSVLLPNAGLTPFTQVACGRQAWRQIQ